MAKKLEQPKNVKSSVVEITSIHNLTGLDGDQLIADVAKTISLIDAVKAEGEDLSNHKKNLKAERGYHMGGFAQCVKLERMEPAEARDWWQTVKTYAHQRGLDMPDLVDMAEAGNA